jgi:predicted RNA-binding protein with PUA domain
MLFVKIIIIGCLMILLGVLAYIVITTGIAFKKFNRLDMPARNRLVLIEYYMAAVRNFTNEELLKLSKLSEDKINVINKLDDYEKKLEAMRESV